MYNVHRQKVWIGRFFEGISAVPYWNLNKDMQLMIAENGGIHCYLLGTLRNIELPLHSLPSWDPRLSLSKFQSLWSSRLTPETLAEAENGNFLKLPPLDMSLVFPVSPFATQCIVLHCWLIARKFNNSVVALRKTSAMQCKLLDNLGSRKAKFRRGLAITVF